MSKSKAKGTAAETAVVGCLRDSGFPQAERRALAGGKDLGDITGIPGLVIEVKAAARYSIPDWMRETETERENAHAEYGVLVVKPVGVGAGNVGKWWAIVSLDDMAALLRQAEYGDAT